MKIQLKQKWELNRFFEYDVSNEDIKKDFKTLAAFRKALKANDETVRRYLSKRHLEHVEDVEQMIEYTLQEKK